MVNGHCSNTPQHQLLHICNNHFPFKGIIKTRTRTYTGSNKTRERKQLSSTTLNGLNLIAQLSAVLTYIGNIQ